MQAQMTRNKPVISNKKALVARKWEHAEEVINHFKSIGIQTIVFEASKATPHIRIAGYVDYWPASSRFFDQRNGLWGSGWESLKDYIKK